ncbi:NAD(P)/FAD-dependent oxidoreductase [Azospirillum thermophilum]|nr:FAD-dependent oxidoreductase [Azospirillum thermophilum]
MTAQTVDRRDDVLVVGAGVVGMASALALQLAGLTVTVVDRGEPGDACSRGNAGHFATEQIFPLPAPGILKEVPGMLLNPLGPLRVRWQYLPRLAGWMMRCLAASRPQAFAAGTEALRSLTSRAIEAYEPLIRAAEMEDLIVRRGSILAFETARGLASGRHEAQAMAANGVPVQMLSPGDLADLEPALAGGMAGGVLFPATAHTLDPWRLVQRLADRFRAGGGRLVKAEIVSLQTGPGGVRALDGDGRGWSARKLVVAGGALSATLCRSFGRSVPLEAERGYHLMLPRPGVSLNRPVTSGERKFIMTPMMDGLRLAGTVEFASHDAPPDYRRAEVLRSHAARLLPGLSKPGEEGGAVPWMGRRPTLPDYLPVIGPEPRAPDVIWAFGHQHLGLTLAGITSRIVTDLVRGTNSPGIDLTPFRIERFA